MPPSHPRGAAASCAAPSLAPSTAALRAVSAHLATPASVSSASRATAASSSSTSSSTARSSASFHAAPADTDAGPDVLPRKLVLPTPAYTTLTTSNSSATDAGPSAAGGGVPVHVDFSRMYASAYAFDNLDNGRVVPPPTIAATTTTTSDAYSSAATELSQRLSRMSMRAQAAPTSFYTGGHAPYYPAYGPPVFAPPMLNYNNYNNLQQPQSQKQQQKQQQQEQEKPPTKRRDLDPVQVCELTSDVALASREVNLSDFHEWARREAVYLNTLQSPRVIDAPSLSSAAESSNQQEQLELNMFLQKIPDYLFASDNHLQSMAPAQLRAIVNSDPLHSTNLKALEAIARAEPNIPEHWVALGRAQQENENDELAISAFAKAIGIEREKALHGWRGLCISLSNEGEVEMAQFAHKWWLKSLDYSKNSNGYINKIRLLDGEALLAAAVGHTVMGEFRSAAGCFRDALDEFGSEADHTMFNMVGATLANIGEVEDALVMYEKALARRPTYVRARYNMAVGYLNVGNPKDASRHMVLALRSQHGVPSESVWRSIRTIGLQLESDALTTSCDTRDLQTTKRILASI